MGWACPACSKELTTERGMRQHHTKVHGEPLPNRVCEGCGVEFYDPKAQRSYCDDCNPNAGEHNGNWKDRKEIATCRLCDDEFSFYPSEKKGVYCPECVAESGEFLGTPYVKDANRVETRCRYCGEPMTVLESERERGAGKYCSRECLGSWLSENVVGEDHHQWKGGTIEYGQGWWRIRRQALRRDDHTCQLCGISRTDLGQEPDVHHIRPVRTFDDPEDAHTLENVVCLCRRCHRLVEEGNAEIPE